jgi:hypothetical protein
MVFRLPTFRRRLNFPIRKEDAMRRFPAAILARCREQATAGKQEQVLKCSDERRKWDADRWA